MGKTIIEPYVIEDDINTPEEIAAYIEAVFEEAEDDAAFIAKAIGDLAKAKGMTSIADKAGLSRESLYKALSGKRCPRFDTILKVLRALGVSLHVTESLKKAV